MEVDFVEKEFVNQPTLRNKERKGEGQTSRGDHTEEKTSGESQLDSEQRRIDDEDLVAFFTGRCNIGELKAQKYSTGILNILREDGKESINRDGLKREKFFCDKISDDDFLAWLEEAGVDKVRHRKIIAAIVDTERDDPPPVQRYIKKHAS